MSTGASMGKSVQHYELASAEEDRVWSPYCWRIKYACWHKGLKVETIPWRFTEKDRIKFAGSQLVPVLVDGDQSVHESFEIARYLEKSYPDAPSLFGGEGGEAGCSFTSAFADDVLMHYFPLIVADIHSTLAEKDKSYFRNSREEMFHGKLEDLQLGREEKIKTFRDSLEPVREVLKEQPFLGGQKPTYADYALVSIFLTAKCTSSFPIIEKDDIVYAWRERVLDLYDGAARRNRMFDS